MLPKVLKIPSTTNSRCFELASIECAHGWDCHDNLAYQDEALVFSILLMHMDRFSTLDLPTMDDGHSAPRHLNSSVHRMRIACVVASYLILNDLGFKEWLCCIASSN